MAARATARAIRVRRTRRASRILRITGIKNRKARIQVRLRIQMAVQAAPLRSREAKFIMPAVVRVAILAAGIAVVLAAGVIRHRVRKTVWMGTAVAVRAGTLMVVGSMAARGVAALSLFVTQPLNARQAEL